MHPPADYTPLESLLLFQSILAYGIEPGDFSRISNSLKNNAFIKQGSTYDARRLSPESLQGLFLQLLHQEIIRDSDKAAADFSDGVASTNSRKRKLQSPSLPNLQTARDYIGKVPLLVDRLYSRYREHVMRQIRHDEQEYQKLQQDIQIIERCDRDEQVPGSALESLDRVAPDTVQTCPVGQGALRPNEHWKPGRPDEGSSAAAPQMQLLENMRKTTRLRQPSPSDTNVVAVPRSPSQPTIGLPGQSGPQSSETFPEILKSPGRVLQVLQAPPVVAPLTSRPAPSVPLTTVSEVLQRPGSVPNTNLPSQPHPTQLPVAGTLKWETPYQPQASQTTQQRPHHGGAHPHYSAQQKGRLSQQWSSPPLQYPSAHPPPFQSQSLGQQSIVQQARPVLLPPVASQAPEKPQTSPGRSSAESLDVLAAQQASQLSRSPSEPSLLGQAAISQSPSHLPYHPSSHHNQIQESRGSPVVSSTQTVLSASPAPYSPQQQRPSSDAARPLPRSQQLPTPTSRSLVPPVPDAKHHSSPYNGQPPRSVARKHILPHALATPVTSHKARQVLYQTPAATASPSSALQSSGTRWKSAQPTPSTPHPTVGAMASPSYEPISPVLEPVKPILPAPQAAPEKHTTNDVCKTYALPEKQSKRRQKNSWKRLDSKTMSPLRAENSRRQPTTIASSPGVDDRVESNSASVKQEEATPRPLEETGDTTADESLPSRGHVITPSSFSSRPGGKRKRKDSVRPDNRPSAPPTHVLWTRGFPRVSASALDQIGSHRYANMFAHQIRDRDAPGYRTIVLHPQDLKSIRTAISAGNKAASAATAALPGGDPGSSSVWLPISEELIPPRGIINSAQLERELVHMFSNAIMYNLDPYRGPGPAFMRATRSDIATSDAHLHGDATMLGYKVDENSVVNDTRAMFVEVEKLLSDLRSTEAQPDAPPAPLPPGAVPASDRLAQAAAPHHYPLRDEHAALEDEAEETSHVEAGGAGGVKRRRIVREK